MEERITVRRRNEYYLYDEWKDQVRRIVTSNLAAESCATTYTVIISWCHHQTMHRDKIYLLTETAVRTGCIWRSL